MKYDPACYLAFVLSKETRADLIRFFPPTFEKVICHHVTIAFKLDEQLFDAIIKKIGENPTVVATGSMNALRTTSGHPKGARRASRSIYWLRHFWLMPWPHFGGSYPMSKVKSPRESVQVSLPPGFGTELRVQADLNGRSMAGQLEHWARIAMALEGLGTGPDVARLKTVPVGDTAALRMVLVEILGDPSQLAAVVRQQAGAAAPTFGVSPDDPSLLVRTDPDGSQTVGRINTSGHFVPIPPTARRPPDVREKTRLKPPRAESKGQGQEAARRRQRSEPVAAMAASA